MSSQYRNVVILPRCCEDRYIYDRQQRKKETFFATLYTSTKQREVTFCDAVSEIFGNYKVLYSNTPEF